MRFENEPIKLIKHTEKISEATEAKKSAPFENGSFGSVRETNVIVSREGKAKEFSLVAKEFKEKGGAEHAFESYEKLKMAGIKILPTYRLDRENNRIFMTNYNKEGGAALSASSDNKHVKDLRITSVTNMDTLKGELEEQCALASKSKIRLPIDAFFFLVPKEGGVVNMDFVIGDLDLIFSEYAKELNLDEEGCLKENLKNAEEALQSILDKYTGTD